VLGWAFKAYGEEVAIAPTFGPEGIDRIERRYQITVERVYSQLTSDEQDHVYGPALWSRDPDRCCSLRKVQPLTQKLSELRAWITGIRREQTPSRAHARKVECDAKFGLIKVNPLADWTMQAVWDHIRRNQLPFNSLHDRNYPSIGCVQCTRAVNPGEALRAGRWPGFEKVECGLHNVLRQGKDERGIASLSAEIAKAPT
jgi:phosphoadenosine phosphosulfate reductase